MASMFSGPTLQDLETCQLPEKDDDDLWTAGWSFSCVDNSGGNFCC
ncbi:hypothetical protein TYRP_005530 [Tyrophagus putrescentiae]|nr:hypothetical protein TYRP_005530 [Tyrophagus putrescentiae]